MEKTNFRRQPKQARSQKRYDAVLDTAAKLFLEKGFNSTTTNEIARRAGISIGSLYQYFNNKEAIVDALKERYVDVLKDVMTEVAEADVARLPTVAESIDGILDPILAFHAKYPAFRRLWLEMDVTPELRKSLRGMDEGVVNHVAMLIKQRLPGIPPERARMVVVVSQLALKMLIGVIARSKDQKFNADVTAEVKRMITAYVRRVIHEEEGEG